VADGIMRIFGPGFERGATALAILLLVPPLLSLTTMMRQALYSLDRPVLGSVSGLLRLAATIATGVVLTWKLGASGAALSLVLGLVVDLAFASHIVVRDLGTPVRKLWPISQWLAVIVASIGAFAYSRFLGNLVPFPIGIIAGVVTGAISFVAIVVLLGGLNERDVARYRDVRQMLANRRSRAGRVASQPSTAPRETANVAGVTD
jgi:O-antigen/teichoic acid export membrane protein